MKKRYLIVAVFLCMVIYLNAGAQQGFGTNQPAPSSVIDMSSNNKGVLLPRVALTSTNDLLTIPSPANSLMVFNTATAGLSPTNVYPGYYYWNTALNNWIRLVDTKNNYYNGLSVDGLNNVGLGGSLNHNSFIFYNDKSLTFWDGVEGNPFASSHSTVLDKSGLKLRYNDGGGAPHPSVRDYYLSIENTRTGHDTNTQLGTPFDGVTTGIKSIFSIGNANNEQYIGGQFGSNVDNPTGVNTVQIGVIGKVGYNINHTQANQVIGGYFQSNNTSTAGLSNYALYTKATGVNPYALYADGGAVLIKDLDATAAPVLTGVRPIYADANGKLVIGSAGAGTSNWGLQGNAPSAGDFFGTTANFSVPVKINNNLQYTINEGGIDFNPAAASFDAVKPWYQLRMFDTASSNENGVYMYKDGSSQLSSYEAATGTINNFFTTIPGTTLGFSSGAYIQASNGTTTQASLIATQFDKITVSNNVPVAFKGIEYGADYSANYSPLSLITKQDLTTAIAALPTNIKGRVACAGTANQTIANANVTPTAVIMITYEDAAGSVISVGLGARVNGTSFVVNFAALPPTTAFINYTIIP